MSQEDQKDDVMSLGPALPGGGRLYVRQLPDQSIDVGVAKEVADGTPMLGEQELVQLTRRDDGYYNVTEIYSNKSRTRVTSDAYREGWDQIFGKPAVGQA